MNTLHAVLLALALTCVSAQRGLNRGVEIGTQSEAQAQDISQSQLAAAGRDAFKQDAALSAANRDAAAVDAANKNAASVSAADRAAAQESLDKQTQLGAEGFKNIYNVANVDAAESFDVFDKTALSFVDENARSGDTAISVSEGDSLAVGERLAFNDFLCADAFQNKAAAVDANEAQQSQLSANDANENLLQAQEGVGQNNEFQLQAADASQSGLGFNQRGFGADNFGFNNGGIFGNGGFGGFGGNIGGGGGFFNGGGGGGFINGGGIGFGGGNNFFGGGKGGFLGRRRR